jgi:hypothetical protein
MFEKHVKITGEISSELSKRYNFKMGEEITISNRIKTSDQVLLSGSDFEITPKYSNPFRERWTREYSLGSLAADMHRLKNQKAKETASVTIDECTYTGKLIIFNPDNPHTLVVDGTNVALQTSQEKSIVSDITVKGNNPGQHVGLNVSITDVKTFFAQGRRIESKITVEKGAVVSSVGLSIGNIEYSDPTGLDGLKF